MDATINLSEDTDEDVSARVAPAVNDDDSADKRSAGTDGTRRYNNQLVGNIAHTTIHSSGQRGRGVGGGAAGSVGVEDARADATGTRTTTRERTTMRRRGRGGWAP